MVAPAVPAAAALWFLRARRLEVSLELNELLDLLLRPNKPVRVVGLVVPSTDVRLEVGLVAVVGATAGSAGWRREKMERLRVGGASFTGATAGSVACEDLKSGIF